MIDPLTIDLLESAGPDALQQTPLRLRCDPEGLQ